VKQLNALTVILSSNWYVKGSIIRSSLLLCLRLGKRILLLDIRVPVYSEYERLFLKVLEEVFRYALLSVLHRVAELRVAILSCDDLGFVLIVTQEERVLDENIAAEVGGQVESFVDLNDIVYPLIEHVFWLFWNHLIWHVFNALTVWAYWSDVHIQLTVNLESCADQIDYCRVIDEEGKRLQSIVAFTNKGSFLGVEEGVVSKLDLWEVALIFISHEQIAHHNQTVIEFACVPDVKLFSHRVVDLDFQLVFLISKDVICCLVDVQGGVNGSSS